jgi:hypothetical protein
VAWIQSGSGQGWWWAFVNPSIKEREVSDQLNYYQLLKKDCLNKYIKVTAVITLCKGLLYFKIIAKDLKLQVHNKLA